MVQKMLDGQTQASATRTNTESPYISSVGDIIREEIADGIMSYWGYAKEFNPENYHYKHMSKMEQDIYIEKKRRKFQMARQHAEKLAEISMNVMTRKKDADDKTA